jgi:hypothetical protein
MNNRAARDDEDDAKYVFTSTVVVSARQDEDFDTLRQDADWVVIEPDPQQRIWTDDYSNVVGAIVRQYRRAHATVTEEPEPKTDQPQQPEPAQQPESEKK